MAVVLSAVALLAVGCSPSDTSSGPNPVPDTDNRMTDSVAVTDSQAPAEPDSVMDAQDSGAGDDVAPLDVAADVAEPPDPCALDGAWLTRVDPDRMLEDIGFLVGLGERATPEGQQLAADYLLDELAKLENVSVGQHGYTSFAQGWVNIEATFAGGELADEYVFAGAHYDSRSEEWYTESAGADDDASGTAALLEIARLLDGCPTRRSVRLLFFSNEEVGTVGSEAYVMDLPDDVPVEALKVYVNVDMIAYGPDDEDLDLATKPEYASLLETMKTAVETWTDLEVKTHIDDHCG